MTEDDQIAGGSAAGCQEHPERSNEGLFAGSERAGDARLGGDAALQPSEGGPIIGEVRLLGPAGAQLPAHPGQEEHRVAGVHPQQQRDDQRLQLAGQAQPGQHTDAAEDPNGDQVGQHGSSEGDQRGDQRPEHDTDDDRDQPQVGELQDSQPLGDQLGLLHPARHDPGHPDHVITRVFELVGVPGGEVGLLGIADGGRCRQQVGDGGGAMLA